MNYIKFLDYLSTAVFSYIGTTVELFAIKLVGKKYYFG